MLKTQIFIRSKLARVLIRIAGSRSMLSNIFKQGSLVSASKPVGVLNRLTGSGAMLPWYQDKLIEVLNRHAGSGAMLAWYQDKPVEVLNRPTGGREISGK